VDLLSQLFGSSLKQVKPDEVQARLTQNGSRPLLLDVRQPEEFQEGHIQGAKLIPLGQLKQRLKDLPRDREIICICRSGNRSGAATRELNSAGYNAVNMQGGMLAWKRAGMPVKKGRN
jgi:rhodanese-related sulfurtransferase